MSKDGNIKDQRNSGKEKKLKDLPDGYLTPESLTLTNFVGVLTKTKRDFSLVLFWSDNGQIVSMSAAIITRRPEKEGI